MGRRRLRRKRMGRKVWGLGRGLKISPMRQKQNLYGNYAKAPYCLDHRSKYSLRVQGVDIPPIRDGFEFLLYIRQLIEDYFWGKEGYYMVMGRSEFFEERCDNLYALPVLFVEYNGVEVMPIRERTTRCRWGRNRTKKKLYHAFRVYPELRTMSKG